MGTVTKTRPTWSGVLDPQGRILDRDPGSDSVGLQEQAGHAIADNLAPADRPRWFLTVWATLVSHRHHEGVFRDINGHEWSAALAPHPDGVRVVGRIGDPFARQAAAFSAVLDEGGRFLAAETTADFDASLLIGLGPRETLQPEHLDRVLAMTERARTEGPQPFDNIRGRSGIRWVGMFWKIPGGFRIEAIENPDD